MDFFIAFATLMIYALLVLVFLDVFAWVIWFSFTRLWPMFFGRKKLNLKPVNKKV